MKDFLLSPRHTKAMALKRKGSHGGAASETEAFLQQEGSKQGLLLKAIWQVSHSTFLLGTLSLVISDAFRFTVPKLLRWVQALGALLWLVVPSWCLSRAGGLQLSCLCLDFWCSGHWRGDERVLRKDKNK